MRGFSYDIALWCATCQCMMYQQKGVSTTDEDYIRLVEAAREVQRTHQEQYPMHQMDLRANSKANPKL